MYDVIRPKRTTTRREDQDIHKLEVFAGKDHWSVYHSCSFVPYLTVTELILGPLALFCNGIHKRICAGTQRSADHNPASVTDGSGGSTKASDTRSRLKDT